MHDLMHYLVNDTYHSLLDVDRSIIASAGIAQEEVYSNTARIIHAPGVTSEPGSRSSR